MQSEQKMPPQSLQWWRRTVKENFLKQRSQESVDSSGFQKGEADWMKDSASEGS